MQGSRGAIGRYLLKWLVVPIVLAVIGFYFVGPRLGTPADPPKIDTDPSKGLPPADEPESSKYKEPDVEVSSRPAGRRSRRNTRRSSNAARATAVNLEREIPSPDEEPPF